MEDLKALSLRQKLAWLVARGFKPIENRPWRTNFRGRFLIHASNSKESLIGFSPDWVKERLTLSQWQEYVNAQVVYGALIGAGTIVDCVSSAVEIERRYPREYDTQWFTGPNGLLIINTFLFDTPIPCRGALGFFVPQLTREGLAILERQESKYGTSQPSLFNIGGKHEHTTL